MNVRQKSLHRKDNCKHAKKRANQRAAKERKRIKTANTPVDHGEIIPCVPISGNSVLKFRVTVECINDGAKSSFITAEGPHGMTICPTLCGKRVACVVKNYRPLSRSKL